MKVIWKYPLSEQVTKVDLPVGSIVRRVEQRPEGAVAWIEHDTDAPVVPRRLIVVGTGQEIPPEAHAYVGTLFQDWLVWHVYEDVQP